MRKTIELPRTQIELEAREGYLFVVVLGSLDSDADVSQALAEVVGEAKRNDRQRLMLDLRGVLGEAVELLLPRLEGWARSKCEVHTVALVVASEMSVVQVNMAVLANRTSLRAFDALAPAQRWLLHVSAPRSASTRRDIPRARTDFPGVTSTHRRRKPSSGEYSAREVPEDSVWKKSDDGGS